MSTTQVIISQLKLLFTLSNINGLNYQNQQNILDIHDTVHTWYSYHASISNTHSQAFWILSTLCTLCCIPKFFNYLIKQTWNTAQFLQQPLPLQKNTQIHTQTNKHNKTKCWHEYCTLPWCFLILRLPHAKFTARTRLQLFLSWH